MNRYAVSPLVLMCFSLIFCGERIHQVDKTSQARNDSEFSIGSRSRPTETQVLAFAKSFCVAMRRHHQDANSAELRRYFDPIYLNKHNMCDRVFKIRMAAVGAINDIQLGKNKSTVLCFVQTADKKPELIVLSVVVREQKLYLTPPNEPAEDTHLVTPWLLRVDY